MLKIAPCEPYLVCSIWKMSCQLYIYKLLCLKERGYTVFQFNLNVAYYKAVVFWFIEENPYSCWQETRTDVQRAGQNFWDYIPIFEVGMKKWHTTTDILV